MPIGLDELDALESAGESRQQFALDDLEKISQPKGLDEIEATLPPIDEPEQKKSVWGSVKRVLKWTPAYMGAKAAWKGLTWTGERISYMMGSPLAYAAEAEQKPEVWAREHPEATYTQPKSTLEGLRRGILPGITSLVATKKELTEAGMPPKTLMDFAREYTISLFDSDITLGEFYKDFGLPQPKYGKKLPLSVAPGLAAEFAAPFPPLVGGLRVLGKAGQRGVKAGKEMLEVPEKLPALEAMKIEVRAARMARQNRIAELGKTLGKTDLQNLADDVSKDLKVKVSPDILSNRLYWLHKIGEKPEEIERQRKILTGETKIKAAAVSHRAYQISGGRPGQGITVSESLSQKANPVIAELMKGHELLTEHEIIDDTTYITKLTKAQKRELFQKAAKTINPGIKEETLKEMDYNSFLNTAKQQTDKLKTAPYQKTLLKMVAKLEPDVGKQRLIAEQASNLGVALQSPGKVSHLISQLLDLPVLKKGVISSQGKLINIDPQINKIDKLLTKLDTVEIAERGKIADEVFNIAEKIDSPLVKGKTQLLKKIVSMQRRFPGQSAKIKEIQKVVDDVRKDLYVNEIWGGSTYFPRMYLAKEQGKFERLKAFIWRPTRIRAPYAKERLPLKPELRKEMKEITEIGYPAITRLLQESSDISNAEFFNMVSKQPGWVTDIPLYGFKKLPDEKAYGVLRNRFVLPQVYDSVMETQEIRTGVGVLYDSLIGAFKTFKVPLSPKTLVRNLVGSGILIDFSGTKIRPNLVKTAWKWSKAKGEEWLIGQKYLAPKTQVRGEVFDDLLTVLQRPGQSSIQQTLTGFNRATQKIGKYPGEIWQETEYSWKWLKYVDSRQKGLSQMDSVKEALKWGIDYSDISQWEKTYVRRVIPFWTFSRKAIPLVMETAAERPEKIVKYTQFVHVMNRMALAKLQMDSKDWETLKTDLPEYMRDGNYMLMPYRDANEDLRLFDWGQFMPWQALVDAKQRGTLSVVTNNPLIQSLYDVYVNRRSFDGKDIYDKDLDSKSQQTFKSMMFLWSVWGPEIAHPDFWEKMYRAAFEVPEKFGKQRLLSEDAILMLMGFRMIPVDMALNKRMRRMDKQKVYDKIDDAMRDISIRRAKGNISEEEYAKRKAHLIGQMQELRNE